MNAALVLVLAVVLVALLLIPPRRWRQRDRMASLGVLRIRRARSK